MKDVHPIDLAYMNKSLIQYYLKEDAPQGDITTLAIFGRTQKKAKAEMLAKQDLVVSGFKTLKLVLKTSFPQLKLQISKQDGTFVKKGDVLAFVSGPLYDLLVAERLLLNILQHLCGVATTTSHFVKKTKLHGVQILDTRKTTPGLRFEEKEAVLDGGGYNHRMGLSDQYLIKDNHIKAAGSVTNAINKVRSHQERSKVKKIIEVEVRNMAEFNEALALKPHIILLDNMTPALIHKIVKIRNKNSKRRRPLLEISGGVNLQNITRFNRLGVERISVGALTHSVKAADISINILD